MALLKIRMGRREQTQRLRGQGPALGLTPEPGEKASASSLRGLLAGLEGLVLTTTHEDQWLCPKWQFSAEEEASPGDT